MSIYAEHRSIIWSNSIVTSFCILPELLNPALQWGDTESRAASSLQSYKNTAKYFSIDFSVRCVSHLKIPHTFIWRCLTLELPISLEGGENRFWFVLDLVSDGYFSLVRNPQHFIRFCTVWPDFPLCLSVVPKQVLSGGVQVIVSICSHEAECRHLGRKISFLRAWAKFWKLWLQLLYFLQMGTENNCSWLQTREEQF